MAFDTQDNETGPRPPTRNTTWIMAAPVLVAADSPGLAELYGRSLEDRGFRVRQGSLGQETMRLAWKRSFSLAIIECQGRLNLAIEIAVAVRFRSRRAPLILFGTGSPVPASPDGSEQVAPIRFLSLPPEASALAAEVRTLLGISEDDTKSIKRRRAKGEADRNETS